MFWLDIGKRIQSESLINERWQIIPHGDFDLEMTSGAHQNKKTYVGPRQSLDIEVPGRRSGCNWQYVQYRAEDRAAGLYQ